MNTGNLHFTKYIRVIMLILLSLWCKEGVGQTFNDPFAVSTEYTHKRYLKISDASNAPLITDTEVNEIYALIVSDLAKQASVTETEMEVKLQTQAYVRWYVSMEGAINSGWTFRTDIRQWELWPFSESQNNGVYWFPYKDTWDSETIKNVLKIYSITKSGVSLSDYSIECVISDEATTTDCGGSWQGTEPTLKVRIIWQFTETGEAPIVDNFSNIPSDISPIEKEITIYEALSPTSASITLNDATSPSYIRWYFADASGNAVANPGFTLSNEGYTYYSQGNSIYYGGTTTDDVDALLNITVTPQDGMSWSDLTTYKLVALLSNEVGTTDENGTLTQEPLIATKYEISFDYVTFASELPDNQQTLNIEVADANAQTATIALSEQWEQIKSDLGAETVTYMKYYWLDGNNSVVQTGSLTGNISFSEHSLAGMHWLKPTDTSFSTNMLDFTASVTSGVITDYKLVILLSDEAATYDENSTWVKEPTLQSMYTVSFYAPRTDFDGSLVSGGISKTVEVTYEYGATTVQVGDANDATDTYSLVYDWGQNTSSIQSLFNYITQSGDNWSTNVYYPNYRRAYVRNKETGELLADQDKWLTWTPYYLDDETQFNYDALFYNEKGEFWTKNFAQYRQGDSENNWEWAWFNGTPYKSLLAVTVNLPEGTDLTFEDIEVVIILAKKDAERETHSADDHTVDLGPDGYEVEYVYSFKEEGVTFENTISATEYKTISIYDELTYENIPVDLGGEAPTYVRWYWSWDGNNVATTDWTFDNTAVTFTDYNGTKYHYAGTTPNEVLNQLTITPPTGTGAKTLSSTNLKLVALVSTKTMDDGAILDASSNLIKEPVIDKKYIISFASAPFEKSNSIYNATTKEDNIYITDEQKNGTASVTVGLDDNLPTILSTFYKSYATDLDAGFYLRWYIVDGNGNRVTDLTGWSLSSANSGVPYTKNNYGYYWYSALNTSTKVSENTNLMNLVVQCPSGTDLTQYKAVCVMSANLSDAAVIDNQLVSEPTWTLQYTYSFASLTFEGSTTNAHSLSETIRLEDANMSSATLSLPLSSVQDYIAYEASSFYIRYYLTDKSGNRVALPTGVTITPTDNSITLTSNDYGHYWYSSTGIGSISDLGVAVVDANSTVDLRNYNVVAVMSSNALQVETDGTVTYEPREMEVVYTFELKKPVDNSFDGACTGVTKNLLKTITEGQTKITLTDLRDDWANNTDNIKSLFGNENPLYRRVYVRNKKTGDILDNQSAWITDWKGDYDETQSEIVLVSDELGSFWTRNYLDANNFGWANFDSYVCKVSITVPTGFSLIDHEVVMILSSKSEQECDYTSTPKTITKGPEEHEVEYIFRFTDGIDRFSGTAATNAIDKSFRHVLNEDENGMYDKTAQLNLSEDMSAEYKTKLTGAETVYLRWYVTDKSGNILSPDASPVSLVLPENDKLHQTEYGYIWYSGYGGEGTFSTDLLNVTATASASVNLYDYNVVCVMTTDVSNATIEDGEFTKESSWEARYTYTFTRAFAGELADNAKTIYKTLVVADDAISVNVPLSKRIGEIRSFFGMKSYDELNQNFHIRWALLDNDGNEVYIQNQLTNSNYYENDYGIYWNTKANKNSASLADYNLPALLDVTYTLSANTNWSDSRIVVYMTDDDEETDGVRTETYTENTTEKTRLIHEPNHLELRYIIDFQTVSEVQSRFVHYKGYTNSDFTSVAGSPTTDNMAYDALTGEYESIAKDIRQQTHEWTYEIYVEPGATKDLVLPILNGDAMEPQAYFRWYDWNTDKGSSAVSGKSGTLLSSIYSEGRGLFGLCLGGATMATSNTTGTAPSNENVGVAFTAPSEEWNEPIVIACDISKYGDGMDLSETYLVHEPTLSYRYKYIIRPARMIADAIKEGVNDPNDNLLENHGDVTIGISGTGSEASLRLNLPNVDNYYFYPYTLTYVQETGERIEEWGNDMVKATKITWRVYDASGLYYMDMGDNLVMDNGLFFTLSQTNINGTYRYKYAPNDYNSNKNIQFNIGDPFYVFAYASDGTNSCPIARFNCRFSENYPIAADDVVANTEYRTRTVNYLDQHYSRVGLISFDVEEGGTLSLPTFPLDNMNPMPFKWTRSHYGYCYPGLYTYLVGNAQRYYGLSPLHGDYTLIKSMNLDDVSENGSGDGYLKYWWQSGKTLRDLTYRYSTGAQNGYFIYVDASEESRPIANVAFEGEMCVGSTLVLSAMVADMTSGSEKPQLIFKLYGIKTDVAGNETERKLVHSFATCDFGTVGANDNGVWYQVYAKVTLQNNSGVGQYKQFIVSIDNYCDNTNGADYAIDDIRIYTQNSKVEVKQNSVLCANEDEYTKADIMIKHETLLAMMPSGDASKYPLPVYYRICDEKGNPLTGTNFYGTGMDEYGEVDFRYYFYDPQSDDANEKALGGKTADWLTHHYQKDVNGNRYFVLNEKGQTFKLEAGKKFYISLALPTTDDDGEGSVPDEYTWGKPTDVCSMYSDPFQPLVQSLKLTVGTNGINRINVDCHKTKTDNNFAIAGILQVPDPVTGELVDIDDPKACHFDWIVEVKDEVSDAEEIKDALAAFRNVYGKQSYTSLPTDVPGDDVTEGFTKVHYETLQKAIEAGKLYISASTDLVGPIYHVGNTYVITAIPLESEVTQSNGTTYEVCPEPMEVTVEARLNGPELNLGFSGIRYADAGLTYGADGLRVGLKQLQDMQSGKPLHLPINAYKQLEKNSETDVEEYVEYTTYDLTLDDFDVIVWDSNDPTWADYLCKDIDLYNTEDKPIYTIGKESVKHITNENRSVELQLHQYFHKMQLATEIVENPEEGTTQNEIYVVSEENTEKEIKYHEGYWYKVKFRYSLTDDLADLDLRNRCYGESYLTIKVVPEYATWGEGLPNNSNWLNDDNWRRSSKAELYKEVVNSDNYPVYDETTGLSNDKGYVPMSFTKVTILNDMQTPYPYLSELKRNVHTNLITEETLTNGDLSAATTNIQYDMMVGAEPTTCPYNQEKTNVYECEHFYGNICDEIYFKPRAQLRYQHYLTYEKAWVEMELSANRWMMLTSPFVQMYAGDFYVPAVEEGSAYPYGRQETEAFQDIKFEDNGIYSRNGYPIYQRSWDKINSKVITATDDALRDDYDAFIDYEWATMVDVVATQWSHVYNDMKKLYEPGRGFSVRLHHTDQTEQNGTDENGKIYKDKKALLRFPKADTEYTYYDHADTEGHSVPVDKSNHHRLAADGVATGMVQITPVANANEDNPYYMVGNPYMASVRMELFFNANPHLVKTYWVVSNGVPLSATEETGLGIIGPMQSFFVKAKDGGQVADVLFSPAMTVSHLVSGAAEISDTDGEAGTISFTTRTTDAPMARTRVILSAEADNGFVDEEDVETLLDSNLEDVPMVYTVAGTQAAMVNRLNDLTLLPLGVFGKEDETVDVQVSGMDALSRTLYFYDASTGRQTLLEEGASLTLEANVHGRYFLTTRSLEEVSEEETDWQVRCYSLQRGELIVVAMPQDNLRQVRIYGVNGRQVVNDATAQSNVSAYALPAGIYVVEVVTERMSRPQAVKVIVR